MLRAKYYVMAYIRKNESNIDNLTEIYNKQYNIYINNLTKGKDGLDTPMSQHRIKVAKTIVCTNINLIINLKHEANRVLEETYSSLRDNYFQCFLDNKLNVNKITIIPKERDTIINNWKDLNNNIKTSSIGGNSEKLFFEDKSIKPTTQNVTSYDTNNQRSSGTNLTNLSHNENVLKIEPILSKIPIIKEVIETPKLQTSLDEIKNNDKCNFNKDTTEILNQLKEDKSKYEKEMIDYREKVMIQFKIKLKSVVMEIVKKEKTSLKVGEQYKNKTPEQQNEIAEIVIRDNKKDIIKDCYDFFKTQRLGNLDVTEYYDWLRDSQNVFFEKLMSSKKVVGLKKIISFYTGIFNVVHQRGIKCLEVILLNNK
jgi:hypothetical protein